MAVAGWSALGTESANVAATMAAVATGSTSPVIADIDNSAALPSGGLVYLRLWITINMALAVSTGGSITLSLRRKRSGVYPDNNDEQVTIPVSSGTGLKTLSARMRIPDRDVYGLFLRNDLGNSTPAAGGVTINWQAYTEDLT